MSFWHWTQFNLFFLINSLQSPINKGNIVIFGNTIFLYFYPIFGYLDTFQILSGRYPKRYLKNILNFSEYQKTPKLRGFTGIFFIFRGCFYTSFRIRKDMDHFYLSLFLLQVFVFLHFVEFVLVHLQFVFFQHFD